MSVGIISFSYNTIRGKECPTLFDLYNMGKSLMCTLFVLLYNSGDKIVLATLFDSYSI